MAKKGAGPVNGTTLYRASEFAALVGVTVRTLHHYDRLGLLKPSGRTRAGYRLYSRRELERLEQIVTLKFLGLPLSQIKSLLNRHVLDMPATLRLQRRLLEEKRRRVDLALRAIGEAESTLRSRPLGWEDLKKIVEVIEMQQNMDWTNKYYSEEAKQKLAGRRAADPGEAERGQEAWAALIADVEKAVREGMDPASKPAQELAARWKGLIDSFTGGDPQVAVGLKKLYADRENWPSSFKKPYSDEVGAFICKAMELRKTK